VRKYKPLAFKSDAIAPQHAVLLGTDDSGGSTLLPLPVPPAGPAPAPPPGDRPSRPIDTLPAIVAATLLDKNPWDLDLTLAPAPGADDSSALVAVRYLAEWTGAALPATTTVIATLHPDGSIGPVDGLLDRARAQLVAGHTRIAIAAGQAAELQALSTQPGIELVEVDDLHAAYRAATGKLIPAPVPVSREEMALDEATAKLLDERYKQWQQRLAADWASILQLESAGRMPLSLSRLRDQSKELGQSAEQLRKRGLVGVAYARMFAASLYASTATQAYDVLTKVQANKIDDAIALLARHDNVAAVTGDTLAKVGARTPRTIGGYVQVLGAFRAALRGWTFEAFATQALTMAKAHLKQLSGKSTAELGSDETAQRVVSVVVPTLLYVGRTISDNTLATEQLDFVGATDVELAFDVARVGKMPALLDDAAASETARVEKVFVRPIAERDKVAIDEATRRAAILEPDYLVAYTMTHLPPASTPVQLRARWGETSVASFLMGLARSWVAVAMTASLLAKYESLGVELDPDGSGRIAKIRHDQAFATLLAVAERSARQHARAARIATGTIPIPARLAYQSATVDAAGSLDDRFDALSQFWASSAYSELAILLARN
jgi:hypothetical protein